MSQNSAPKSVAAKLLSRWHRLWGDQGRRGQLIRPTMRFLAIKAVEQRSLPSLHRARDLLVRQRTQLINGLRGLVAEFGTYDRVC